MADCKCDLGNIIDEETFNVRVIRKLCDISNSVDSSEFIRMVDQTDDGDVQFIRTSEGDFELDGTTSYTPIGTVIPYKHSSGPGPEPVPVDDGVLRITIDTNYGKNFTFSASGASDYIVDWGDGTTSTGSTYHSYLTNSVFNVTITKGPSNNFPAVTFSNSDIITSVDSPIPFMNGVTTFNYFLSNCPHISSVPEYLFYFNPQITKADGILTNNSLITSLPAKLMEPLINVTTLISSFSGLTSLTSIPVGFFDNCTNVIRFYRTFKGCTNLVTIPDYLFNNTIHANDFEQCFQNCNKLTIPTNLFCNDATERATRFVGLGYINIDSCFMRSSYTGTSTMTVPELWNYTYDSTPGRWGCFGGAGNNSTNIINYSSIPSVWNAS